MSKLIKCTCGLTRWDNEMCLFDGCPTRKALIVLSGSSALHSHRKIENQR